MKVNEYAKQCGKKPAEVLEAINTINGEIPEGEEAVIKAGAANANLSDDETELLNSYFGFEPDSIEPKKLIPLHEIEVVATRLKGSGPALVKATFVANDEQDAVRQLILERKIKPNAYRFRSRRLKELGDHVRNKAGELVPAV